MLGQVVAMVITSYSRATVIDATERVARARAHEIKDENRKKKKATVQRKQLFFFEGVQLFQLERASFISNAFLFFSCQRARPTNRNDELFIHCLSVS